MRKFLFYILISLLFVSTQFSFALDITIPTLQESDDDIETIDAEGGSIDIELEGVMDWDIFSNRNWINITMTRGLNGASDYFTIKIKENRSGEKRYGKIIIGCEGFYESLRICQLAYQEDSDYLDEDLEEYELYCDEVRDNQFDNGEVRTIMESNKSNPYNIVVLGDGFTKSENTAGGAFDQAALNMIEFLFKIPPFSSYSEYFTVSLVYAHSQDSGADNSPSQDYYNTVFNSSFNNGGIERLLVSNNHAAIAQYESYVGDKSDLTLIIVNSEILGGSGGQYATVSTNSYSLQIMLHEIGHLFGLADEYVDTQYATAYSVDYRNAANLPNVDITNDPSRVKWSHFIGREGYEYEGIFEGGYFFQYGVYRPQETSIMKALEAVRYNAISRETIVKKILQNAGEQYDFYEFLRKDDPYYGL